VLALYMNTWSAVLAWEIVALEEVDERIVVHSDEEAYQAFLEDGLSLRIVCRCPSISAFYE